MGIKRGTTDIGTVYIGSTEVTKIYQGSTEVYSASNPIISLTDLQFYFPLDGTVVDKSGNGNTLLQTSTSFGTGKFGQALAVNGSGSNDAIINSNVWGIADAFSVAAWVNATTFSANHQILTADASFQGVRVWQFRATSSGAINFIRFDSGGSNYQATSSATLSTGTWHHVAATFSTANGSRVYVDGTLSGTNSTLTANSNVSTPVAIGNGTSSSVGTAFPGSIDEAMLFSRELTATEISTLAAGTAPLL